MFIYMAVCTWGTGGRVQGTVHGRHLPTIKKEGATPHHGARKFSLQYDGRPDERFGVLDGMWNLGSLSGNGGKVCEELRWMIDVCCLQEVRCRGQLARMLGMKGR